MQQKDRKQMYRQQTMSYFINAALEIIEEEGYTGFKEIENRVNASIDVNHTVIAQYDRADLTPPLFQLCPR